MRSVGRILVVSLGLALLAGGALSVGIAHWPEGAVVDLGLDGVRRAAAALEAAEVPGLPGDLAERLEAALARAPLGYGLALLGPLLIAAALLPGRARGGAVEEAPSDDRPLASGKALKAALKAAAGAAKRGMPLDAGEICFSSGLLDEAAKYFIEAGEFVRAAEIRHDQNRFIESAELHLKGGGFEAAGSIFSQQREFARAAEAYLQANNQSVAAEMFERAEDFRRAADCYAESGFSRQAAQAYVRCGAWLKAARCLEEVILEEGTGSTGAEPGKRAELRKLALTCGDLYQRGDLYDEAQAVLLKGECFAEAAEVALKCGRQEQAAELFLEAGDAPRAAEVLRSQGEDARAAQVLAEYHRDRGEDEQAARYYEEGGDHLAAGDIYRALEQLEKAGECYERQGDPVQAAEMFRGAGDRARAGENYERAGMYSEAAECFALAGQPEREAELLTLAGEFLRAGEIHHRNGLDDDAIKVLQQVEPEHADFAAASALLGEIFAKRGMHSLAIAKLSHAVGDRELTRGNVKAFYALAAAHEADEDFRTATELYERILAFDYHFADVEERLARTRQMLESATPAPAEAPSGSGPGGGSGQPGRYRITGKLGRGGMGIVYKAEDTVLDRTVAFKVLPAALKESPQALKNFLREAKSAAQLNHPNIVTVYDAGEQDDAYYIAMEYVDGSTLKEIVKRRGKISPGGIVHVLAQMCEALSFAHEKKIVHRDIKTANTMWTRDRKAKIMDFGLAKVIEEVLNHTTVVSGTPYYMSPEQTLGRNVDHRTDIYSLGVTVFELATGALPFQEGNLPYHHVHTPPPDPRDLEPQLPAVLAAIINRCLQKDPDARYQSAREILAELKASRGG